jgi:LysR family hydrogen peroxide-inducible transcriptional activator
VDLRQLNALLAVADHGTFSAAAKALHTVQSNVSNHVGRLERELGVTLVDRSSGQLTAEGEVVAAGARRINGELDGVAADVAALRAEVSGSVRLGMIGTTARWLAPALMEEMAERYPKVHLIVTDATTTSLLPQLLAGNLDLAVVNLPIDDPEVTTELLFTEDTILLTPADHPFAHRAEVDFTELDGMPLLLEPAGTSFRRVLDARAADAGITLVAKAEVDWPLWRSNGSVPAWSPPAPLRPGWRATGDGSASPASRGAASASPGDAGAPPLRHHVPCAKSSRGWWRPKPQPSPASLRSTPREQPAKALLADGTTAPGD